MFTGIITAVGQITSAQAKGDGLHLQVEVPQGYLDDVVLGDSIAMQGACMTATQIVGNTFNLDISRESLNKTVGLDTVGPVNLEKALRLNDRLGGHLVSGHVDGVGSSHARALEKYKASPKRLRTTLTTLGLWISAASLIGTATVEIEQDGLSAKA